MKTISFNTGRKYTVHGQRVVATLHDDGVVTYFDHDRMVHGEFTLGQHCSFNQTEVMHWYDSGKASNTSRAWADGMQRGGCNSVIPVAYVAPAKPEPKPEPSPAPTQVKVDPEWLVKCGREALACKWLNVTHIRQTTDGPYYTVDLPDGGTWVVAGFRLVAEAAGVGKVSPVKLEQAHQRIARAEEALGRLTAGQRRDLVADSFPGWFLTTVRMAVDAYPVPAKPREV